MSKRQDQNASSSSRNMSKRQVDQNASLSSGEVDFVSLCEDIVHKMEKALKRGKVILSRRGCQDLATKLSFITACIREHELWWIVHKPVVAGYLAALYRYFEKAEVLVEQCTEQDWCPAAVFQVDNLYSLLYIWDHIKYLAIEMDLGSVINRPPAANLLSDIEVEKNDDKDENNLNLYYNEDLNELRKRLEGLASERSTSSCIGCGFFLPAQAALKQQHLARYLLKKHKFQLDYETSSFTSDALETIFWEKDMEPKDTWGVFRFLGAGFGASGVMKTSSLGSTLCKEGDSRRGIAGDFYEGGMDHGTIEEAPLYC